MDRSLTTASLTHEKSIQINFHHAATRWCTAPKGQTHCSGAQDRVLPTCRFVSCGSRSFCRENDRYLDGRLVAGRFQVSASTWSNGLQNPYSLVACIRVDFTVVCAKTSTCPLFITRNEAVLKHDCSAVPACLRVNPAKVEGEDNGGLCGVC